MKKIITILIIVIVLCLAGAGGWYFFSKKNSEGGVCASDSKCQEGLKCINKICSSGEVDSVCLQKSDCKTQLCVDGRCTEGKVGDSCVTYNDCLPGLLCQKSLCITPPDSAKYFNKVIISKMKTGMPPGPDNMPVETTEFKDGDGIEVDFRGVKPTAKGDLYYDFIDAVTGETVVTSKDQWELKLAGQDTGFGTDIRMGAGVYDFNLYFNNELVSTTQITVK